MTEEEQVVSLMSNDITEIIFTANYLPPPSPHSFSSQAAARQLVLVTLGFSPPDQDHLLTLKRELQLTCPVVSGQDEVLQFLSHHDVQSLPWKVMIIADRDSHEQSGLALESPVMESEITPEKMMSEGIRANNELNDFCEAAKCFSRLLTAPTSTVSQRRDALFNMASLLHMHNYMSLSLKYLEKLLMLEGGSEDMTAHSFLWSVAQGCLPSPQETVNTCLTSKQMRDQVVSIYRQLALAGDVLATHKYRAITGHTLELRKDEEESSHIETLGEKSTGNPAYASLIFDNMASVFEKRLVKDLHYDCPWRMKQLLDDLFQSESGCKVDIMSPLMLPLPAELGHWRILDVGCGSGLIGRLFTHLVGLPLQCIDAILTEHTNFGELPVCPNSLKDVVVGPCMIGVDISERMAKLAFANGGYSITLCDDLNEVLRNFIDASSDEIKRDIERVENMKKLDMLVAADTFLYVGPLDDIFSMASKSLVSGGLFLFSTEDLESSPMRRKNVSDEKVEEPSDTCNDCTGSYCKDEVELLSSARYAHSQKYIERLAAKYKFHMAVVQDLVIRKEASVPLPGKIFLLQNTNSNA